MRLAAALLALSLATPALAQSIDAPAGTYKLEPTHASLTFRVMHLGLSNYTMRFAKFDSTVELDTADVTRSKLTVSVDPRTLRTDFPFPERVNFDNELATGDNWLQGKPIAFTSTKLVSTGAKTGKLTGNLTLRGVTRPVTLDVTFNGAAKPGGFIKVPTIGFSATGSFKRSEFGLTYGVPAVGDDITMQIEAEYQKAS